METPTFDLSPAQSPPPCLQAISAKFPLASIDPMTEFSDMIGQLELNQQQFGQLELGQGIEEQRKQSSLAISSASPPPAAFTNQPNPPTDQHRRRHKSVRVMVSSPHYQCTTTASTDPALNNSRVALATPGAVPSPKRRRKSTPKVLISADPEFDSSNFHPVGIAPQQWGQQRLGTTTTAHSVQSTGADLRKHSHSPTPTMSTDSGLSTSPSLASLACCSSGTVGGTYKRKSASLDSSHDFGQWPPHGLIAYKRRGTDPIREYQRMLVFQEIETYRKRVESEEEHRHQQINAMKREQEQEQLQMTRPMDNKNFVLRRKGGFVYIFMGNALWRNEGHFCSPLGPMHFCTPIVRVSASRILLNAQTLRFAFAFAFL
uniref:Uncharacterized protein n=1 Tax=Globodera rostochiensis TaxID=31243 RepID=A0A914GTX6_GLORO